MTSGMRWRIFVLQIGLIGILAFVSGFAFWASSFATSTVHDQLAAQQIYFPAAGSAAITSLPKVDATAMTPQATMPVEPATRLQAIRLAMRPRNRGKLVSMPIVLTETAFVFCNMAACSSRFEALPDRAGARPVHPILKIV